MPSVDISRPCACVRARFTTVQQPLFRLQQKSRLRLPYSSQRPERQEEGGGRGVGRGVGIPTDLTVN